jgi:hypothetical protein
VPFVLRHGAHHAGVAVVIDGVQYFDGTVERQLFLGREDYRPPK